MRSYPLWPQDVNKARDIFLLSVGGNADQA
jgi:hypothetical protein